MATVGNQKLPKGRCGKLSVLTCFDPDFSIVSLEPLIFVQRCIRLNGKDKRQKWENHRLKHALGVGIC